MDIIGLKNQPWNNLALLNSTLFSYSLSYDLRELQLTY